MNKKIIITGSSGFVGKKVYLALSRYNTVVGLSRSDSIYTDHKIDITATDSLFQCLQQEQPEIIIHCAYFPHVEGCEMDQETALKINIQGTNHIIDWCKNNNTKLIFLSTDYVYSLNANQLNNETAEIGALNFYTQNKIDNEKKIIETITDFLILRTGFIYGFDTGGKNFLMQMLQAKGNWEIPADQMVNPTNIDYLCTTIEKAIDLNLTGIFNANGKESISRYDFAQKIAEILNLKKALIPVKTSEIKYKAKRPLFCQVDSSLVYQKTGIVPKSNEEYLIEIKEKIKRSDLPSLTSRRDNCRGCRKRNLIKVVSLGEVPLANSLSPDASDLRKIPLDIFFCEDCSLLQILDIVPSETLFLDYRYVSSVSKEGKKHFTDLAQTIKSKFNPGKKDLVLEIGSNDGVLLAPLQQLGINGIGMEPSLNIAKLARSKRVNTINTFFNIETAREFVQKFGPAKIVAASNVFAHIDDMDEIMQAVYEVLDDTGTLMVEVHYVVAQIENFEFDNFYHEHLCEYSVTAFNNLLNRFDMEVYEVQRIPIHGGSIRLFAKKKKHSLQIHNSVNELINYEQEKGFGQKDLYLHFASQIEQLKADIVEKITALKAQGKKIAGYGASARGTILLNICNLDHNLLDYVIDNSAEKQGRYLPGVNLKIYPASHLQEDKPDYILIIAYTYAPEIMDDESWFKKQGGEFIIPNNDFMPP